MDFGELNELNGRSRSARKAENTYKWETRDLDVLNRLFPYTENQYTEGGAPPLVFQP